MLARILRSPRRRRIVGVAAVLAGIGLAVAVLLSRGDGSVARPPAAPQVRTAFVPQLGLVVAYPSSWTRTIDGRVIRLRSPEGSILLTVASPVPGRHPADVKRALLAGLRKRLAPATTLRSGPARLGPRHVVSVELSGHSGGHPVRALALVEDTKYRSYAVTLLTSASPSARGLHEAQAILQAIRFVKPVKVTR